MRRTVQSVHLDTDAPDPHEGLYLLLEPGVILLGDLQRLGVLRQPGGLLGVPLEDGEEDDQEGGVGGVEDLAPHTGAQDTQLLQQHFLNRI